MLNHTSIQGRLVRDPELRYTQSQTPVCSFTVAWSEKIKDVETKLFLNCVAWRGTAELVSNYWRKGQEIVVEGKLATRQWQDKEGNNRSSTELTVQNVHFCGPKESVKNSGTTTNDQAFSGIADDDDLPF